MSDVQAPTTDASKSQWHSLQANLQFGSGFPALLRKEVMRFYKVSLQTVGAPVLTAVLYIVVFAQVMQDRVQVYEGVSYLDFLIPGLVIMSMMQNAFANSSSSLMQSRITGNLVFILLPPLSPREIFTAFVLASILRGLVVGIALWLAGLFFDAAVPLHVGWVLVFAFMACAIMGCFGLVAGLCSEKFDQLAAFQNFLIMPMTFLSGVFYSIHTLPDFWQKVSYFNPVFYMIDGFRYGFFGISDVSPWRSFCIVLFTFLLVTAIALRILASGYKLRT
ncbi:ABC transporter permease [Pelistega europaea]|uniref:Transport permease protein n=1 Tax=Pelistega europaea TaxID=106147 RepID=A0A7Y4LB65_9BURK|nr:ABC transporter permease [Pelistega europaea]NOL50344.1 ABC transporter permease [Pelistega europaea]